MSIRIKIGGNEKIIQDSDKIVLPALFNGQINYDFSLVDDQSQLNRYYRVHTTTPKNKQQTFCELSFQNVNDIHSIMVKVDGNIQSNIPDIVTYFHNLEKNAQTDSQYYWTILGLAESVNNDEDLKAAVDHLGRSYHEYPEIVGIITYSKQQIEKIRDSMGFLTLSLDTTSLSLFVDGKNRGKFNLPIALEEGEHQVEIRKDAKIVSSKTVVVRGKEHKSVAVGIFENPSEQKEPPKYPETTITQGAPLPAYASNTMLAFMLAVVLIPVLYFQQNFTSLIIMGGVGLLSMYGIIRQKKWGLAFVGGIYLLLLFNWGYASAISIVVLILLFVYYRKDGTTWEWF